MPDAYVAVCGTAAKCLFRQLHFLYDFNWAYESGRIKCVGCVVELDSSVGYGVGDIGLGVAYKAVLPSVGHLDFKFIFSVANGIANRNHERLLPHQTEVGAVELDASHVIDLAEVEVEGILVCGGNPEKCAGIAS